MEIGCCKKPLTLAGLASDRECGMVPVSARSVVGGNQAVIPEGRAIMSIIAVRTENQVGSELEASTAEPLTPGQVLVSLLVSLVVSFLG